jgi:hypothetical protein
VGLRGGESVFRICDKLNECDKLCKRVGRGKGGGCVCVGKFVSIW